MKYSCSKPEDFATETRAWRAYQVEEVKKVLSKRAYLEHANRRAEALDTLWTKERADSATYGRNWGYYVGLENIRKYYVDGNVNSTYSQVTEDNWTYGIYNQIDASGNDGTYTAVTKDTIRITTPIAYEAVTTHTADVAYERVLDFVGASLHRDALDQIIIDDVRNGTATFTASGNAKGIIDHPSDVKGDGWEKWPPLTQTEAKQDTDGDGMPDDWETANGLNPNDASDGNAIGEEGYTNLEIYMNALVADITQKQNEGGEQWSGQQTTGIETLNIERETWNDDSWYTIDGRKVNGQWSMVNGQWSTLKKGFYIQNGKKYIIK